MRIADALPEQIPAMAEMERAYFSDPWTESQLASQLTGEGHIFLSATGEDGALLGYISAMYVLDEGYIGNVAVRAECRRRGVGKALIAAMRTRARALSLAFLTLEVRESNAPARALYEGCGFRTVGLRKNYYEKPREDAVLMTLLLGNEDGKNG